MAPVPAVEATDTSRVALSVIVVSAAVVAVIVVSLTTVKFDTTTLPTSTAVAPRKPTPLMVRDVPPVAGPSVTERAVTVGRVSVNWSDVEAKLAPSDEETVTSTVALAVTASGGVVTLIVLSLATVKGTEVELEIDRRGVGEARPGDDLGLTAGSRASGHRQPRHPRDRDESGRPLEIRVRARLVLLISRRSRMR